MPQPPASGHVTHCRLCRAPALEPILDYGDVALADGFLDPGADFSAEPLYPLQLCICSSCGHLQIDEIIDPDLLFRDYIYVTGVSDSVIRHASALYDAILAMARPPAGRPLRVVEGASNDGTVLQVFKERGAEVLGIDPARNIAAMANARGIPTIAEPFNTTTAREIAKRLPDADVFIARNVLAHVADLHGFVEGIATVLAPQGIGVIEVPHALTMFDELQYDQVFHEHIGYFTLDVLIQLFDKYGLTVFQVREIPLHGGSLQVHVGRTGVCPPSDGSVEMVLAKELARGIATRSAWTSWAERVRLQRDALRTELAALKAAGKRIAAYGASGKGQSLLQFCGIDGLLLDYVVDKSNLKHGKLTPRTHLPVYPTERLLDTRPDVVLLTAWNFAGEILRQQQAYVDGGGRMLHPLPMPHYL